MVTNHLRAPYGVYFTQNRTSICQYLRHRTVSYYLKLNGARTAFCRVIEGKMTSTGHRTVPGRRPADVAHIGRALADVIIYRRRSAPV